MNDSNILMEKCDTIVHHLKVEGAVMPLYIILKEFILIPESLKANCEEWLFVINFSYASNLCNVFKE